jgi:hypothetical protein
VNSGTNYFWHNHNFPKWLLNSFNEETLSNHFERFERNFLFFSSKISLKAYLKFEAREISEIDNYFPPRYWFSLR